MTRIWFPLLRVRVPHVCWCVCVCVCVCVCAPQAIDNYIRSYRHVARGGSVGSDEPPSQIKGPLFQRKGPLF